MIQLARVRKLFALALLAAAAYHLIAMLPSVAPSVGGSSSPARHALFVLINAAFALGFWRPPRGFAVLVGALCVQQILSHGATLLRVWRTRHELDWPSVLVLIAMPLAVVVVVLDARARAPR